MNGRSFASEAITTGGASDSESTSRELVARVTREPRVVVHYDPEHPATAALVVGVSGSTYMSLAFAITWLCFCLGFVAIPAAGAYGSSPRDVVTLPSR